MIQRLTAHYDVLDNVVRFDESREGPVVRYTDHLYEVMRLVRTLRATQRVTAVENFWKVSPTEFMCVENEARTLLEKYKEIA